MNQCMVISASNAMAVCVRRIRRAFIAPLWARLEVVPIFLCFARNAVLRVVAWSVQRAILSSMAGAYMNVPYTAPNVTKMVPA